MKPEDLYVLGILVNAAFNCFFCYGLAKIKAPMAYLGMFFLTWYDMVKFDYSTFIVFIGMIGSAIGAMIGLKSKFEEKKKEDKESSSDKR